MLFAALDALPARPIKNSAMMVGIPMNITQARYTIMKAPPPLEPASAENRHRLPKPTEQPIAANVKAKRDDHCAVLELLVLFLPALFELIIDMYLLLLVGTVYAFVA